MAAARDAAARRGRDAGAGRGGGGALGHAVWAGVQAVVAARCKTMAWRRIGAGAGADPARIWPCGRNLGFSAGRGRILAGLGRI